MEIKEKILLLDVDGVLTNGLKYFDEYGNCIGKQFIDRDRTYSKLLKNQGWIIEVLTGDSYNSEYCLNNISSCVVTDLDKSNWFSFFSKQYKVEEKHIYFIGDSYYDLSLFNLIRENNRYCPVDAEICVKNIVPPQNYLCNSGTGVLEDFYYRFNSFENLNDS